MAGSECPACPVVIASITSQGQEDVTGAVTAFGTDEFLGGSVRSTVKGSERHIFKKAYFFLFSLCFRVRLYCTQLVFFKDAFLVLGTIRGFRVADGNSVRQAERCSY